MVFGLSTQQGYLMGVFISMHSAPVTQPTFLPVTMRNFLYLQIGEDVVEYLVLRYSKGRVIIVRVGAVVDDPVHVKVEIVKLGNLQITNTIHTYNIRSGTQSIDL